MIRFESVTAYAFGPIEGESLDLAPRMNVVFGTNEAGKSSWHAAIYTGLCGVRRGRGQPRREDSDFAKRHRPWDGDRWEVGAVVCLQDGRRVELRHDLDGRVDCSARDVDIAGRDYSGDIMHEGAPDGSQWLGLDRRSFLSTACVRQADVLGLLDHERAPSLQEQLQRAAATAGTDQTAAAALTRLRDFQSTQVGLNRSNSAKPLRTSHDREQRADATLRNARAKHEEYLNRVAGVEQFETRYRECDARAAALEAVVAEIAARRVGERLERAHVLASGFPGGSPPAPRHDEDSAQTVATALHGWEQRPPIPEWLGPTLAELDQQAAMLRDQPRVLAEPLALRRRPRGLVAVGAATAVVGLLAIALGPMLPGVLGLGLGFGIALWGFTRPVWSAVDGGAAVSTNAVLDARQREAEARVEAAQMQQLRIREAHETRERALARLREAAASVSAVGETPQHLVDALTRWQRTRHAQLDKQDHAMQGWGELQSMLDGGSVESLEQDAQQLRAHAELLAAAVEPGELIAARATQPGPREVTSRDEATAALGQWEHARGELREFAAALPDVAIAEEELAVARVERERVESLDRTLQLTIRFLEDAQGRVHRNVAPVLRSAVLEWLSRITGGRYDDCRVDPETLTVEVRGAGGSWRPAELLSHGTAEQLYLLLRVAMTRHLTRGVEPCPLILDDVIASCDRDRRVAVLEALHELSTSTQVILFSQEQEVLQWAQRELLDDGDRLIELDQPKVPA
ncbi:MAG: ATP-binding protein [Chloroflexota bacterium]